MWDFAYKLRPEVGFPKYNEIIFQLRQKFPQLDAQFAPTKVLFLVTPGPTVVQTCQKAIRTVDDFKGLKLVGGTEHMIKVSKAIGWTGVAMGPGDWFMALDKKTVDGATLAPSAALDHKLVPLLKYITNLNFSIPLFEILMNKDKYNSLPQDIQKTFDEVSGQWVRDQMNRLLYEDFHTSMKALSDSNLEIITFSPEEITKINDKLTPVYDDYVNEMKAKGLPGREILDEYHRLLKLAMYKN